MPWDGRNSRRERQAGEHEFASIATGATETFSVVFDVPFDQVPSVVVTDHAAAPENIVANAVNRTATGFDIKAKRVAGTSGNACKVSWQAMAVTQ